jgi:hypothetical protein
MVTFGQNMYFTFVLLYKRERNMKLITIVLFSMVISLSANAQTDMSRKGLVFGFSAGIANSKLKFPNENQNNSNLVLNWKIGYMLNPKLALLLNGAVSIYEYDLTDRKRLRDFGGLFASSQYFVSDKLWILGGIGIGTDSPVFYDLKPENTIETKYYSGIGAISSVGYEIFRKKNFALDLQARINYSSVNLPIGKLNGFTTALLLGINLY